MYEVKPNEDFFFFLDVFVELILNIEGHVCNEIKYDHKMEISTDLRCLISNKMLGM